MRVQPIHDPESIAPVATPRGDWRASLAANLGRDAGPTLRTYVETIAEDRWLVLAVIAGCLLFGGLYAVLAPPVYEADVLVQVEEKKNTIAGLDDLAGMFGSQSPADTEIEILRSRMLVGAVVDELRLDVVARPRYLFGIGGPIARHYTGEGPAPARFGLSDYSWGGEVVQLAELDVPARWEDSWLTIVARDHRQYDLLDPDGNLVGRGEIGKPLSGRGVGIVVSAMVARPGSRFLVERRPRADVIEQLQKELLISESGKKTGIIRAALRGHDEARISDAVNAIARTYVRQNVERRSAEAEKTLAFITGQLPQLKLNLDRAEAALNSYRQKRGGGFDLSVETQSTLDRAAGVERMLTEVEMQRSELAQRFTGNHPSLAALSRKAERLRAERDDLDRSLKALPETELNAARLTRDVKVSSELYMLLLNKAQELQVVKSGTIGNVRILDAALLGRKPVQPNPRTVLLLSLVLGTALGIGGAFVRRALDQTVDDPELIEREMGLPVYATIPHSPAQALRSKADESTRTAPLLAVTSPHELAIEALRSLRTSLQFALVESTSNIVTIAGPSPGVGKSFVCANLAQVVAEAGLRVLLVDADLRRGRLHRAFGAPRTPGLSDCLRGAVPAQDSAAKVVRRTSAGSSLELLTTGERPPNPSELLSSQGFRDLIAWASREYDLVLVDTPPLLAVTDAAIVGRIAAINLLVVRAGQHPLRDIVIASKLLAQNGASPRAIVVNDIMPKVGGYAYAQYQY